MDRNRQGLLIKEALINKASSYHDFCQKMRTVSDEGFGYMLGPCKTLAETSSPQRTCYGTYTEIAFCNAFGLPRRISKAVNPNGLPLDTRIDGIDVDIKCTLGGKNWSIPGEAFGNWCLLIARMPDGDVRVGLFFVEEDRMNKGENQDKKRTIPGGINNNGIIWLMNPPLEKKRRR